MSKAGGSTPKGEAANGNEKRPARDSGRRATAKPSGAPLDECSDLGAYAVNSEAGCPWIAISETPRCAQRQRQSKPSVKVTNILFNEMADFLEDEYWVRQFKKMSTGRMPKGFKMQGPELIFRKRGGKTLSIIIPKLPEKVGEVIEFYHQCGVYSPSDEKRNCQNHQNRVACYKPKTLKWGNISRNKLLLDQALVAFADKKVEEVDLGDDSFMELFQLLKLAAVLGVLTPANVVVKEDVIEDITVLEFDEPNGIWNIDFSVPRKRKPKPKPREKGSIAALWKNYLEMVVGPPVVVKVAKSAGCDGPTEETEPPASPAGEAAATQGETSQIAETTDLEETTELE